MLFANIIKATSKRLIFPKNRLILIEGSISLSLKEVTKKAKSYRIDSVETQKKLSYSFVKGDKVFLKYLFVSSSQLFCGL